MIEEVPSIKSAKKLKGVLFKILSIVSPLIILAFLGIMQGAWFDIEEFVEKGDAEIGLMVKCTPERGQKCSLFHLMVKCTPIIVELPSVYRGCKSLICFQ